MNKYFIFAEKSFTVFVLFFSTAPLIPLFRIVTEGEILYDGDPLTQAIWFVIYLVNFILAALRWKKFIHLSKQDWLLLLITGLAVTSFSWSNDPMMTLRRSVALINTTIFGIYLASRYTLREQLQLLAWALSIAVILSPLFAILPPHFGIETRSAYAGVWRGIYFSKNSLGTFMSLSAIVFLLLGLSKGKYKWLCWIFCGLSLSLLVLSTAKNPLICLLAILILIPIFKTLRWQYSLRIPFLIAVILISSVVGTLFISNADSVLGAMGKDITLTGRTELWYLLFVVGQQHSWMGHGFSAFWLGWNGPSAIVWNSLYWQPHHAHNGLVQLWLDLGFVGVLLFGLSFIKAFLRAFTWVRSTTTMEDLWPLVCLTLVLLRNISESEILAVNNPTWILYVATIFTMAIQRRPGGGFSYASSSLARTKSEIGFN